MLKERFKVKFENGNIVLEDKYQVDYKRTFVHQMLETPQKIVTPQFCLLPEDGGTEPLFESTET